jgi:hypothetical protein
MAACGYTPCEIDDMPMQDVMALLALWRQQPPTHEILASVHRVTSGPPRSADDPSGIGALIARSPDGRLKTES